MSESEPPREAPLAGLLAWLRLEEPPGLSAERYWACVWASLVLAVSLGLQATVLGMIVLGPLAPPPPVQELTLLGRSSVQPEWDLPAFYGGCLATLLAAFALVRAGNARICASAPHTRARSAGRGAVLHALLAAASLSAFLALVGWSRAGIDDAGRLPAGRALALGLPALAALAVAAAHHLAARPRTRSGA